MSNALEVLKRIVREEYKNIKDGVNIHPSGFRDYTPEENSDFDEPHSTEKMESVNEARSTNREWNKFEKAFGDFFTTVLRLGKANTKVTGDKTDEKIFIKNFNRDVGKFYSLMQSWVRGQNESVNEECCDNCKEGKTCCSVKKDINEAGMGILTSDQADVLQAIVMRNKNKNLKALLRIVLKDSMFKGVDKKELLGYIDGARQFVKYMKSHPMG